MLLHISITSAVTTDWKEGRDGMVGRKGMEIKKLGRREGRDGKGFSYQPGIIALWPCTSPLSMYIFA